MRRVSDLIQEIPFKEWTDTEILRAHSHGVDFGSSWMRHTVLARSEKGALIKVPGHMAWQGLYCPRAYSGSWVRFYKPGIGLLDGEVFQITRTTPLSRRVLEELKKKYL